MINITLKPVWEKTRGIASLQVINNPDELDSLTVVFDFSINREMRLYHERANSIRPYTNGILLCYCQYKTKLSPKSPLNSIFAETKAKIPLFWGHPD